MQRTWKHNVPYRAQLESDTCVPTCIGMAMDFFECNQQQKVIDVAARTLGNGRCGIHKASLQTVKDLGFLNASMGYTKSNIDEAMISILSLLERQPVIVTGKFQHHSTEHATGGHAILLIGFDSVDSNLLYHDPHHLKAAVGEGHCRRMPQAEFYKRWSERHHGWSLWLQN